MKRKIALTLLLSGVLYTCSFGQVGLRSNAHVGFVYPLSTNGVQAPEYSNRFSIHAISGVSRSEEAFCAAGVASVVKDTASGCIASGIANVVLGSGYGVQAAGVVNYNGHYFQGLQASGFVNITKDIDGVQMAGFTNVAYRNVNGAQGSGFLNLADSVDAQMAGFLNLAKFSRLQFSGFANVGSEVEAAQLGGFVNVAESTKVQMAGFANVGGDVAATQLSGFANIAKSTKVQVSGFVNVAEDINGAQVAGFINVAKKVKGVQVAGFINVADSCDFPIGLINIIGNGEQAIGLTVNEIGTTIAAFRSGGKRLYGIVGLGGNFSGGYQAFSLELGMGLHVPLSRSFRINTEATIMSLSDRWRNTDIRTELSVLPSVRMGIVEVFGGPSFAYTATSDIQGLGRVGYSVWSWESRHYSEDLSFGFKAGVQIHLNNKTFASKKSLNKSISE